jgi:hypothetical protein
MKLRPLKLEAGMSHGPINHDSLLVFVDLRHIVKRFVGRFNAGKATLQTGPPKKKLGAKDFETLGDFEVQHDGTSMTFTRKQLLALHDWTGKMLADIRRNR